MSQRHKRKRERSLLRLSQAAALRNPALTLAEESGTSEAEKPKDRVDDLESRLDDLEMMFAQLKKTKKPSS